MSFFNLISRKGLALIDVLYLPMHDMLFLIYCTWIFGASINYSVYEHEYLLILVDDHSKHTWIFLMKSKTEVAARIKSFISLVETQSRLLELIMALNLACIHFIKKKALCIKLLVLKLQMVFAEYKHQDILKINHRLMFQSNIPKHFGNFVAHAVCILNRLPSLALQNKSPFEVLHHKPRSLSFFERFWKCFA